MSLITRSLLGFLSFLSILPNDSVATGQENQEVSFPRAIAVKQLNEKFEKRLAREDELQKSGQRTLERLKAAQQEMEKVQMSAAVSAAIQQQAVAAEMESQALAAYRRSQSNSQTNNSPILFPNRNRNTASPAVVTAAISTSQLNQLSVSARAIVERFQECTRDLNSIQSELTKSYAERKDLLDDYWELADPCSIHSIAENEKILVEFENVNPTNEAGRMARAILLRRIHSNERAINECTEIIDGKGMYSPLAYAVRADVQLEQGDAKKSKTDLGLAMKGAKDDPYVRWIRAQIFSQQRQWLNAEEDWRVVLKSKKSETMVRRELALILAHKQLQSKRSSNKPTDEIELASGLSTGRDWNIELAFAFIHHANGKKEEALKKAEKAKELAIDEQKEICQKMIDRIEKDESPEWDFDR